jgi:Fe2+ or Zn2+ uptake regulation protein
MKAILEFLCFLGFHRKRFVYRLYNHEEKEMRRVHVACIDCGSVFHVEDMNIDNAGNVDGRDRRA